MSDPIACEYCGVEFVPHQHNQRFCSARCKERARMGVTLQTKVCPTCGKTFETHNTLKNHCSRECRLLHQRAVRHDRRMAAKEIEVAKTRKPMEMKHPCVCEGCGKEFLGKYDYTKYCSRKCREAAYDRRRRIARNLAAYAESIDGQVAEAQASWNSEYPSMGDDEIYGNMVSL